MAVGILWYTIFTYYLKNRSWFYIFKIEMLSWSLLYRVSLWTENWRQNMNKFIMSWGILVKLLAATAWGLPEHLSADDGTCIVHHLFSVFSYNHCYFTFFFCPVIFSLNPWVLPFFQFSPPSQRGGVNDQLCGVQLPAGLNHNTALNRKLRRICLHLILNN